MNLYGKILIEKIAYLLIMMGALNCGFIGLFKINLINYLTNQMINMPEMNRVTGPRTSVLGWDVLMGWSGPRA